MDILLTILKIIGIILLVIIGILLLLIAIVLFVPVRYKLSGKNELEGEKYLKGHVHWLLHILSIHFSHDGNELTYQIRIFGKKLSPKKHVSEEELFDEDEPVEDESVEDEILKDADTEPNESQTKVTVTPESEEVRKSENISKSEDVSKSEDTTDAENIDVPTQEVSVRNPFRKLFQLIIRKIKGFQKKIIDLKNTIKLFFKKLRSFRLKFGSIKEFLIDEKNKAIGLMGFREVQYLLRHFRFRKIDTDISFSIGDPALTGLAMGLISMFPILYQYNSHVYPDFESEEIYARGTIDIVGHLRVIHLLSSFIRLIKEKDVRALIKKWLNRKD